MTNEERYELLGDFFIDNAHKELVTTKDVANKIYSLKDTRFAEEYGVSRAEVAIWVSKARKSVEAKTGTTIYCIPSKGYKMAKPREYAIFTAKWMKRTFQAAKRTRELSPRVDQRYIPLALRMVFGSAGRFLDRFSTQTEKMIPVLQEITKQRKED